MFAVVADNGLLVGDIVVVRDGAEHPRSKMVAYVRNGVAHVEGTAISGMIEQSFVRGLGEVAKTYSDCNRGTILGQFGFDASASHGALAPNSWCRLSTFIGQ